MNERLKILRSALGLNQTEFAEKTSISRSMIAAFETGTRDMKELHISQICTAFNVNPEWLRHGSGSMFVESDTNTIAQLAREYSLKPIEQKMLEAYVELPAQYREGVTRYIETLVASIIGTPASADPAAAIDAEVEAYRQELLAEKKAAEKSSRSENTGA